MEQSDDEHVDYFDQVWCLLGDLLVHLEQSDNDHVDFFDQVDDDVQVDGDNQVDYDDFFLQTLHGPGIRVRYSQHLNCIDTDLLN